jgi:protein-disulfide isomerase
VNWTSVRPWIGTVIRLGLAAVWFFAGLAKVREPAAFVRAVRAYDVTPEWLSQAIGYGLPILEICLAVLLVLGLATRAVAIVSATLLTVFIIGVAQAGIRGIKLECGCFGGGGSSTKTTYLLDIARDSGLLLLSIYLIIFPITMFSLDRLVTRGEEHVAAPSAKRMRRDPRAVQRYQAVRAARHKEVVSQERYITLTVAVVVLLTCIIGISVQKTRAKVQGSLTATNASVKSGVTVGKSTAPVVLDVYEDFQCPICLELEQAAGTDIANLIKNGTVRVNYHMLSFLDSSSNGNRYSSRAANAAICASDVSPEAFQAFHTVLYGKDSKGNNIQPAEGGNGRTDAELEAYFKKAVPKATADQITAFQTCLSSEEHAALVSAITDQASKNGVSGTPTVHINGKKWTMPSNDADVASSLVSAINAAQKDAAQK